jgi:hypothetical protein
MIYIHLGKWSYTYTHTVSVYHSLYKRPFTATSKDTQSSTSADIFALTQTLNPRDESANNLNMVFIPRRYSQTFFGRRGRGYCVWSYYGGRSRYYLDNLDTTYLHVVWRGRGCTRVREVLPLPQTHTLKQQTETHTGTYPCTCTRISVASR